MANFYRISFGNNTGFDYRFEKEMFFYLRNEGVLQVFDVNKDNISENNFFDTKNGCLVKVKKVYKNSVYLTEDSYYYLKTHFHFKFKDKIYCVESLDGDMSDVLKKVYYSKSRKNLEKTLEFLEYRANFSKKEFLNIYYSVSNCPDWFFENSSPFINYQNKVNLKNVQEYIINNTNHNLNGLDIPSSHWLKEWWLKRGWDEDYANKQIHEIQKKNSDKSNSLPKPNIYDANYYIQKFSVSLEDAEQKVIDMKNRTKNSLENFIKKYGKIEGERRYFQKREKWLKTMNDKSLEEKVLILEKKSKGTSNFSNVSQELFEKIDKEIEELNIKTYFSKKNHEYGFWCKSLNKGVLYDYVIPELKIAIEYNGSRWHPNKEKLNSNEWKEWCSVYTHKNADEVWEHDQIKNEFIQKQGYDLYIIWDYEYLPYKQTCIKRIVEIIKNKFNEIKRS